MDRQTITVDIAPGSGPIQRIRLSQGDIGRQLGVYIIQNGAAVDCSGYSAHLYVLKPDKNYYEKTCSISSNLISWETAEQETPLAGECKAQIRITANGMDIGTANFIEAIEATPAAGGTASESLISSMTQYVDAAESAARTAVAAEDTVEEIISTYSGIPDRVTKAEASVNALGDGLAIMANGNTHAAIAAGQAVFVRNHSSLSEGLYWANAAIGTNATLSTSNLTADASGGLNALKAKIGNVGNTDLQSQVSSLNSKFGIFGNTSNPITDLNDLPMFGSGYTVLAASISPTGSQTSYSFTKQGAESSNRYTVTVTNITSAGGGNTYVGYVYNGTFVGWEQLAFNSKFATIEDNQITQIGNYIVERSAFKARRVGQLVQIFSYVNVATQVPKGTDFADTGFSNAEGTLLFIEEDGSKATVVTCSQGRLCPNVDLQMGYYYAVGSMLSPR